MQTQQIPEEYICPITGQIMKDPVVVEEGHSFEREAIEEWFSRGKNTNPITNTKLKNLELRPNFVLKGLIDKYKQYKTNVQQNPKFPEKAQSEVQTQIGNNNPFYVKMNNKEISSLSNNINDGWRKTNLNARQTKNEIKYGNMSISSHENINNNPSNFNTRASGNGWGNSGNNNGLGTKRINWNNNRSQGNNGWINNGSSSLWLNQTNNAWNNQNSGWANNNNGEGNRTCWNNNNENNGRVNDVQWNNTPNQRNINNNQWHNSFENSWNFNNAHDCGNILSTLISSVAKSSQIK